MVKMFNWFLVGLSAAVNGLMIWLYYPGIFTVDNYYQMYEVRNLLFQNNHPAINQILWWLLLNIWNNPVIITIFQSILVVFLLWFILKLADILKVKTGVKVVLALVYIFSPVNLVFNMTLWKDSLFSILICISTCYLILIYEKRKYSKKHLLVLAGLTAITSLIRFNGLLFAVAMPIAILFLPFKRKIVSALIVGLGIAVFRWIIVGPIYAKFNVKEGLFDKLDVIRIHETAGVLANNGKVLPDELKVLAEVMPIETWKSKYVCTSQNPLIWDKGKGYAERFIYNEKTRADDYHEVDKVTLAVVSRNIPIVAKLRWCMFKSLLVHTTNKFYFDNFASFHFNENMQKYTKLSYWQVIIGNDSPKLNPHRISIDNFLVSSLQNDIWRQIFWTPLNYLILFVMTIIFKIWRQKNFRAAVVFLPIFVLFLGFLFGGVDIDFRYTYPWVLAVFLLPLYANM